MARPTAERAPNAVHIRANQVAWALFEREFVEGCRAPVDKSGDSHSPGPEQWAIETGCEPPKSTPGSGIGVSATRGPGWTRVGFRPEPASPTM
ncbi:Hypothetical protein CINCED_3A025752 [Cinara cedri]|uniref:Uncharacterized protein n=1 Tax=Cinara cedri TaxID=506608 RepID=A0A5E4NGF6_9HEMI|nr:Hypothetical protein CINCED_3A025752 [Cinara cedri]